MLLKGKNNAVGQLYASIDGLATTCQITAGHTFTGIEMPFNMTIYDLSETDDVINYEIVTVTNIATNVGYDIFSITRAQEGTSAQGHLIGKNCANLITYGIIDGINDAIGTQTYTEQNFVTNGESMTNSLDAIDVGLNSHLADYANKFPDNAGAHNAIFRGDNLGSTPDYVNIANNTFKNMYIGDYFTVNGRIYDIAHINYYINTGDTALTTPHLVLVPREPLYSHVMNDSNTTEGGYIGSKMYTQGLTQAISTIKTDFPNHVLSHRRYFSNAVADGKASAGAWIDSEVDLMTEHMVYGGIVNGDATYGLYNVGVDKSQLALFRLRPDLIGIRTSWWLRDVASAASFAGAHYGGLATLGDASRSLAVRPAFSIS